MYTVRTYRMHALGYEYMCVSVLSCRPMPGCMCLSLRQVNRRVKRINLASQCLWIDSWLFRTNVACLWYQFSTSGALHPNNVPNSNDTRNRKLFIATSGLSPETDCDTARRWAELFIWCVIVDLQQLYGVF